MGSDKIPIFQSLTIGIHFAESALNAIEFEANSSINE